MKKTLLTLSALLSISSLASADTVITNNGATLTGDITLIDKGVIHLKTDYAGELKIKQDEVLSFETDDPVFVRLESGTTMAGPVSAEDGNLAIKSSDGAVETKTSLISASWSLEEEDPELVRNRRTWKYNASLDLSGKTGNTEKFSLGSTVEAMLSGPNDALSMFFEYEKAEEEGIETDDRTAGGASYESFFSAHWGWYVRTVLESDAIDEIDLRSTSAGGISYRIINKDYQTLVARTGLGYRYTSYDDNTPNESTATLDFGLAHTYRFDDRLFMRNNLTYGPSIDDFGNYRVVHDTSLEIPVGSSENWKIRIGLRNEFDSQPAVEEKLDTSYYTKMVYSWN